MIYLALRAMAAEPSLWQKHVESSAYDKLLFRSEDFVDPGGSALCRELMRSPDKVVRELTERLLALAGRQMQEVPALADLAPRPRPKKPSRRKKAVRAAQRHDSAEVAVSEAAKVVLDVLSGPMTGRCCCSSVLPGWRMPTHKGSSTATSSRRMCSSTATQTSS